MKKIITIILFFLCTLLNAQENNQLNTILIESLRSFLNYRSELQIKEGKNCEIFTFYVCKDGLPTDFPFDNMQNVTFFSLENLKGLPKPFQKQLKKGINVHFILLKLINDKLVITISGRSVKHINKKNIEIGISDWGIFTYKYSYKKQKWLIINTKYGGI